MAKQKSYQTREGKKKEKKLTISSEQNRLLEKGVERDIRIEQGFDPAFQGGGAHGGTVDAQKRRARKKSKEDASKYRNKRTRDLEE
jgi:hypothetical protein